jgi:hypothetical protein
VLSRETVDEMCMPVAITDLESWTAGHGLGPQLFRVGERVFAGHGGSMPGYVSFLAVHRRSRTGVIVFANAYTMRGGIGPLGLEVLTAVLDAEPALPPPWVPAGDPTPAQAELSGRWWWMGREHEIRAEGAELVMTTLGRPGMPAWRFVLESPDRWRGVAGQNTSELLQVHRAVDGAVTALDVATFVFKRDPAHLA